MQRAGEDQLVWLCETTEAQVASAQEILQESITVCTEQSEIVNNYGKPI